MSSFQVGLVIALLPGAVLVGQSRASVKATLAPQTTLPITFTKSISAARAKPGDVVLAKTVQLIRLADGREVQPGAVITGHVLAATPFAYDKTPYAKQRESVLEVQFDSLTVQGGEVPLHVSLRAIADPIASWDARKPASSDLDPLGTVTQVGGDQLIPSQAEIRSSDGDVVGYNKRSGPLAHLIANTAGGERCDSSNTEQAVSIFSASACGMYGFTGTSMDLAGSSSGPSRISFSSTQRAPTIWRNSTALLEVLPESGPSAIRE